MSTDEKPKTSTDKAIETAGATFALMVGGTGCLLASGICLGVLVLILLGVLRGIQWLWGLP